MKTILSNRLFTFGMTCVQCRGDLIAPEWSEYRNERQICGTAVNVTSTSSLSSRFLRSPSQ